MKLPLVLHHLEALSEHIPHGRRVLILTSPSRRHLNLVEEALEGRELQVFDQAKVHVPREVVELAMTALDAFRPDVILTLGGGAATGLGKALRLKITQAKLETERGAETTLMAIPTTYSGSEMTQIWGITEFVEGSERGSERDSRQRIKTTGRAPSVRPSVVVHDPRCLETLSPRLAVESLFNALAHPISALSVGLDDPQQRATALRAVNRVSFAAMQTIRHHRSPEVRRDALAAVRLAGQVLDTTRLGAHHKVAHRIGGAYNAPHAALHALLLPHTLDALRHNNPKLYAELCQASGVADLARFVHESLTRVGSTTSLRGLKVTSEIKLEDALSVADHVDVDQLTLFKAWLGARPSVSARDEWWGADRGLEVPVVIDGDIESAQSIIIALHGRGSDAWRAVAQVREAIGHRVDVVVVGPQAADEAWYHLPYSAPTEELSAPLEAAIQRVGAVIDQLKKQRPSARYHLYGFSQGACLALEVAARELLGLKFENVFAIAGARPSGLTEWPSSVTNTHYYLSRAEEDRWIAREDFERTAESLRAQGAHVSVVTRSGSDHRVTDRDRLELRRRLGGLPDAPRGFGGHHQAEVLPGAVPLDQNTPRHSPYGLYPEQLNGSGFTAKRHENHRAWLYRVRPSAQHTPYVEVQHPTLTATLEDASLINLSAWEMPSAHEGEGRDFVDGLITIGGAGHPTLRRGYAIHLYTATRDMSERAFTSADGDLLIVPERGALTLLTELGVLEVSPGHIAVIPRGMRFSVLLDQQGAEGSEAHGEARGYVGEVYARPFKLPERGVIGSNGLADERHFIAPTPWYEDRLAPGYQLLSKLGGRLYEAKQDHSPYDVVGWHGDYTPYVYDLTRFSPVGNTRVDHGDPSVYSVLSAGLDEQGAHALDLVVFPPRWDTTEHTFRPPFFHRNVTTEINGIIRDPSLSAPFSTGMVFVTPSMTAHGVRARSVHAYLQKSDVDADAPSRLSERSLWFQFESALPFQPTTWALQSARRLEEWPAVWGEHAARFHPTSRLNDLNK